MHFLSAPSATGLGGAARRAAVMMLAVLTMPLQTAWATSTSTINVGGTDYTLFTGFTATDGNGNNWANLVDGNTSTDWMAEKTKNHTPMPGEPDPDPDAPPAPTGDFAGGTEDPAFVEFHADAPIIPKGYVLTCGHQNAGFWKPVQWALKARLNEGDAGQPFIPPIQRLVPVRLSRYLAATTETTSISISALRFTKSVQQP